MNIIQSGLLSIVARIAILVLAGPNTICYVILANEIVNLAFGLILGTAAVAAATAFGIGGRNVSAQKLEEWAVDKKEK